MDSLPINVLDIVLLVVIFLSALVGVSRGFLKEVLSVLAWVGAAWATLTFYPDAQALVQPYLGDGVIADLVAGVGLFLISVILLTVVARILAGKDRGRGLLGPLDRTLGLLFGIFRGAVLVCLGYFLIVQITAEQEPPEWVTNSRLLPYVQEGADLLSRLVPRDLEVPEIDTNMPLPELELELPTGNGHESDTNADSGDETGYSGGARQDLERLIENQIDE